MERALLGINHRDNEIRGRTMVRDIMENILKLKWRWDIHIGRNWLQDTQDKKIWHNPQEAYVQ